MKWLNLIKVVPLIKVVSKVGLIIVTHFCPYVPDTPQSAFFSVSVSAASFNTKNRGLADQYVAKFWQETGWRPDKVTLFGGALQYSKYNLLTKFLLQRMTKRSLGPTVTWRDYEFTDWEDVTRFAEEFLVSLPTSATKS